MDFGGRYLFAATRQAVWAALNDTEILKAVIPGCRAIAWTSETTLDLAIQVNFGIVQPVFAGELGLSDVRPAERCTLTGRGRGGLLGLAQGAADITLADHPDGTILGFEAVGKADGGLLRLGRAIIGNSAQKVIDGFFESIGLAMGVEVRPVRGDDPQRI